MVSYVSLILWGYCNSLEHAESSLRPGVNPPGRPLPGSTSGKTSPGNYIRSWELPLGQLKPLPGSTSGNLSREVPPGKTHLSQELPPGIPLPGTTSGKTFPGKYLWETSPGNYLWKKPLLGTTSSPGNYLSHLYFSHQDTS